MIIEKIIFGLLAFSLFVIIFIKMIKKNDTTYLDLLIIEFTGIAIYFIELICKIQVFWAIKLILYVFCVIIPIAIVVVEKKKNILFSEVLNISIAKFYLTKNNSDKAKKYILKVVDKYPKSYYGHKMLAEIYEKDEKYTEAIDEYSRATEINNQDYNSYYKMAFLFKKENNNQASIDILNDLLKKKPEFLEASLLLGDVLYFEEKFKEANQVYLDALKYNPDNYDIYYNLGMCYTMLNDFKKAKEYYGIAAEINSIAYNAKFNLAQIAMIYGELNEAEIFFMECLQNEELETGAYYYLAQINMLRGDKEKAINYLNVAIEVNSNAYNLACKEELFNPIIKYVRIPQVADEPKKPIINKLTKKEKLTQRHLKETYELVTRLNNYNINKSKENKNIEKIKEHERDDKW